MVPINSRVRLRQTLASAEKRDDGSVLLNLQGYNPDVLDGHPFSLNVNLESNFSKMASDLYIIYEQAVGFFTRAAE